MRLPLPRLPLARAVWKPAPDLATSAEAWLTAGGPHHTVLSTALGADELTDLAGMRSEAAERLAATEPSRILDDAAELGIRFVVPGDDEWPAGLGDLQAVEFGCPEDLAGKA